MRLTLNRIGQSRDLSFPSHGLRNSACLKKFNKTCHGLAEIIKSLYSFQMSTGLRSCFQPAFNPCPPYNVLALPIEMNTNLTLLVGSVYGIRDSTTIGHVYKSPHSKRKPIKQAVKFLQRVCL